jgi:DNA-binding MarR family transcriptional regulator
MIRATIIGRWSRPLQYWIGHRIAGTTKELQMTNVVVLTNLTLDGVTQAPGRLNEDRRGGLQPGGWATPRADPVIGSAAAESMATAGALLLGSNEGERLARELPALTDAPPESHQGGAMATAPTLSTQVIGQAERALGALMDRVLARIGGTFHQWVALNLATAGGGSIDRDQLRSRMTGALKIDDAAARAAITELSAAQLLEDRPGQGARVGLTDTGQARYRQLRTAIDQLTTRLYGDLSADDLVTAGRVLAVITARANTELAGAVANPSAGIPDQNPRRTP